MPPGSLIGARRILLFQAFATKLIRARLELAQIAGSHIQMTRAHAIRLMGLAHYAASSCRLWTLSLVVHRDLRSQPVRPYGARS